MEKLIKIVVYLLFISQLLITSSCSCGKEEPKDLSIVVDSLLIEYYTMKITVYSNLVTDRDNKEYVPHLVDRFIFDDKFFKFKNFNNENIQLPDSFFIDKSFEWFRYFSYLDTRYLLPEKVMPITASKFLQKRILGNMCGNFADKDKMIFHPWKLNYSNLYETYLLPVVIQKKSNDKLLELNFLFLITAQDNKIRSIVEVSRSVLGNKAGYKTFTRTNRKFFFLKTESLFSNVVYNAPPIETMPVVPRNIEFYTQFYFDANGFVKFVEE